MVVFAAVVDLADFLWIDIDISLWIRGEGIVCPGPLPESGKPPC